MHKQINLVGTRKVPVVYPWKVPPLVANQIDLFMHFLGTSRDGQVARPVEMDKLSSSDASFLIKKVVKRIGLENPSLHTHIRTE